MDAQCSALFTALFARFFSCFDWKIYVPCSIPDGGLLENHTLNEDFSCIWFSDYLRKKFCLVTKSRSIPKTWLIQQEPVLSHRTIPVNKKPIISPIEEGEEVDQLVPHKQLHQPPHRPQHSQLGTRNTGSFKR